LILKVVNVFDPLSPRRTNRKRARNAFKKEELLENARREAASAVIYEINYIRN